MLRANKVRHTWACIVAPIILVSASVALKTFADSITGGGPPLIYFYPAIIISSFIGGLWGGINGTVWALLATTFFYFGQKDQFDFGTANDQFRSGLFLFTSLTISWTFEIVNRQRFRFLADDRAKKRFIGILCHELRIPLNRSLLQAAEMLSDPELPLDFKPKVGQILNAIQLQSLLIQEVVLSMKVGRGIVAAHPERISIEPVVHQAMDFVRTESEQSNVRLLYRGPATSPVVLADRTALLQLFWNLLRNAIKFSPSGSEVQVVVAEQGSALKIQIQDQGRGILPTHLERIFNAYEQTSPEDSRDSSGGLGLGLWICRELATALSGKISATSEGLGKGATFTVELPLAKAEIARVAKSTPVAPKPVLIVEDDAVSLKLLCHGLSQFGISARSAGSVAEARAVPVSEIGCVITDLHLKDGTGWEVLRHFRSHDRTVPIFCLSGDVHAASEDTADGRFDRLISKPVSLETIAKYLAN